MKIQSINRLINTKALLNSDVMKPSPNEKKRYKLSPKNNNSLTNNK